MTENLSIQTRHDDFDWSIDKRNRTSYSKEDIAKYDDLYNNSFVNIVDGEIFKGHVMAISKTDVVINIGYKSDGLVSLNEFRDLPNLAVGDEIEVFVVSKEDQKGQLVLSRKRAQSERAWTNILKLHESGEVVIGHITSKTKGGLIVDLFGIDTFLPGSQIDVKPVTDYDQFVGKTMEFKVVKINETIRNAVVSHKILIEKDMESQRVDMMYKLEKGQIVEGVVKNITDFGAFLDLGGLDGLLYITDISWGRINHPSEVLKLEQKINVVVLDFNDNKKRISLGLKQLTPHPWDNLDINLAEGSKVTARVVNVEDYGGFLEIIPGVEGLVHVSEISWSNSPINSKEFFKLGETHEVTVVKLNREERKISLSIKRLVPDPWDTIESAYPVGSKYTGVVKNLTQYGVFVEFETGIGGMVHISDLSWVKRFNHPNQFIQVGEKIEVIVLNVDRENRKLQLGHKQIDEDPWVALEANFQVGSKHQGTVIKKDDKGGAVISLPYGLEGYATEKNILKEGGKHLNNEENADFIVIEFNINDRRLLLSHTKTWEKVQAEVVNPETLNKEEKKKTSPKATPLKTKIEKSTLGDLFALNEQKKKDKEENSKE